jgi:hypothetical protein
VSSRRSYSAEEDSFLTDRHRNTVRIDTIAPNGVAGSGAAFFFEILWRRKEKVRFSAGFLLPSIAMDFQMVQSLELIVQ